MTEKKYEFVRGDAVNYHGYELYRIRALVSLDGGSSAVKAGALGGYIWCEDNLSHEGQCWVGGNAKACGYSRVTEDAKLYGNARIEDHAILSGHARVLGNAVLSGYALATDYTVASGSSIMYSRSKLTGHSSITDNVVMEDDAHIAGASVSGMARLEGTAFIQHDEDVQWYGGVGSEGGTLTAYRRADREVWVTRGCFTGSLSEFKARVISEHQDNKYGKNYILLIAAIEQWFE